jgi:hypothetical protein
MKTLVFSAALFLAAVSLSFAQQDTLQIAFITDSGEIVLLYSDSQLMGAFEAGLNDGTTMSDIATYDTLGYYYLLGWGVRGVDEVYSTTSINLLKMTDDQGRNGLFVYSMSMVGQCETGCRCRACRPAYASGGHLLSCTCDWTKDGDCGEPSCKKILDPVLDVAAFTSFLGDL